MKLYDIAREMRPRQWTKNLLVFAAFFFAIGDRTQSVDHPNAFFMALAAACLFCLVSSAIYIFNDIQDAALDRAHPIKRNRPVASGAISVPFAGAFMVVLFAAGLAGAWLLMPEFALIVLCYVALQIVYTLWLKKVALVDVFIIALGFVLRAVAGAVVCGVEISDWLLICAFLMALFLGLCKRREEIRLGEADIVAGFRPSLLQSDERLLDQLIAVAAAATVVSYAVYTQSQDTVAKFGTRRLALTIPFVLFGIFRYLDLVYRHFKGGEPEYILLTDAPLLADIALYGAAVILVIKGASISAFIGL